MSTRHFDLPIKSASRVAVGACNCVDSSPATGTAQSRRGFAIGVVARLIAICAVPITATAHDGAHGHGHEKWHADFYSKLERPDTKTSCCNLADCRPTELRVVAEHYEVLKDGRWIRVPVDKIVKVTAPDGGAHICAPPSDNPAWQPDDVFCIVMPLET